MLPTVVESCHSLPWQFWCCWRKWFQCSFTVWTGGCWPVIFTMVTRNHNMGFFILSNQ